MSSEYQSVADVLQILSHPVRLQIVDVLRSGEACVCHLQTLLDRPQPYVSQQLGKLREADLVADRREGLYVYYSLGNSRVEELLQAMLGAPQERGRVDGCECPECEVSERRN